MIYVRGDIHGSLGIKQLSVDNFPEQKEMTKNDYLIILGDFGLVWNYGEESKEERYWLDWLESKSFTTLFIDGNHENYDRLNDYETYPIEMWNGGKIQRIRHSVIHLMRGQVFMLEGLRFFTFGGASSHDISDGILEMDDPRIRSWNRDTNKLFRINHLSWWKEELPTQKEMNEGWDNLEKYHFQVDFILTHCAPTKVVAQLGFGESNDILTDYLNQVVGMTDFKTLFCGHYHIERAFYWDRTIITYEKVTRVN